MPLIPALYLNARLSRMSEYNPCCFCLGTETDVPPFGKLKDAEDFVNPCSTCTLNTHRKCLLDWFSSLPTDKLKVVDALSVTAADAAEAFTPHDREELGLQGGANGSQNDGDGGAEVMEENFEMLISPQQVNRWINNMTLNLGGRFDAAAMSGQLVLLVASCPQCKGDITFSMKRSQLLSLSTSARTLLTRTAQIGCVFTVMVLAITGVISILYIGLTTCGLKIVDALVPGPLLVKMLLKAGSATLVSRLRQFMDLNAYSMDTMELALLHGMIDPLKFARIPILPIVLYRMRSLSLISCLVGIKTTQVSIRRSNMQSSEIADSATAAAAADDATQATVTYNLQLNAWITEFMINGYLSSLGNHKLVKALYANFVNNVNVLQGIDFWNVNNMVSLLVPLRWLYDLFYRLTLNRLYFNLAMKIRPRDIANSLPPHEFERLEQLDSSILSYDGDLQYLRAKADHHVEQQYASSPSPPSMLRNVIKSVKKKVHYLRLCQAADLPRQYALTKTSAWLLETKACIENDYLTTLLYQSFTLRCLTTVLWPYFSSKVGAVIFKTLLRRLVGKVPPNTILLLANIIGLVGVVFAKDCINLYLCSKKAQQLSNMVVIGDLASKRRQEASITPPVTSPVADVGQQQQPYMLNFPGGYSMSIRLG